MTADEQGSRDKPLYTDIAAMLDGTLPEPPTPEVLSRSDGRPLFYKGEVNLVFGDPEQGKTWVIFAGCAEVLIDGGRVIYVDLDHNGAAAIVSRLLLLGVPAEILRDPQRFRHCEPTEVAAVEQVVADCQQWKPDVAVIESTASSSRCSGVTATPPTTSPMCTTTCSQEAGESVGIPRWYVDDNHFPEAREIPWVSSCDEILVTTEDVVSPVY